MRGILGLLAWIPIAACAIAQQPATSPANETNSPVTVRSRNSTGADLAVPLCPQHFRDSVARDGSTGRQEKGIAPASVKTTVPALMTEQAVEAGGATHMGNFAVVVNAAVDTKGLPHKVCIEKSSGYGLDASAAKAVSQYVFLPAKKNGRAVKTRVAVEVEFATQNPPPMGMPRSGSSPQ
jgi:TonB family protein